MSLDRFLKVFLFGTAGFLFPSSLAVADDGPVLSDRAAHEQADHSFDSGVSSSIAAPNLEPPTDWSSPVADEEHNTFFLSEILEYRLMDDDDEARWDVFGWHGGDYNRLWVKSEGQASVQSDATGEGDLQVLYGRLISNYFDFQVGLRLEQNWGEGPDYTRGHFAVGVQGLAPYYFDIEPTLFISHEGDVSARFTGTYDILLTQRLILQPRLEGFAAVQEVSDFGVGSGINSIETGLRLRYEISREFAPYIGVNYSGLFGESADFASEDGNNTETWSLVSGVRFWF